MNEVLRLETVHVGRRQLSYSAVLRQMRFTTSIWYDSVDLQALEARLGATVMQRVILHIVLFDMNRLLSLKPAAVDVGPFKALITPELQALWHLFAEHVWAQWRYENGLASYDMPGFDATPGSSAASPACAPESDRIISLCGGGKDSLVVQGLLRETGIRADTLGYSHAVYGGHEFQHSLIDAVAQSSDGRHHRLYVTDDFLSVPVLHLDDRLPVRTVAAAETPFSVFAALPVVLAHGANALVVGHEQSADLPNLIWPQTGEPVNHQWGKSLAADQALDAYVGRYLVRGLRYFSVLKPVRDPVIFGSLRREGEAVRHTHSCNVRKPWCGACAKCAYVLAGYLAFLDDDQWSASLRRTALDTMNRPENEIWFRQMLGLEAHTPFECVGQADEARLLLTLAAARGVSGGPIDLVRSLPDPVMTMDTACDLFELQGHGMPDGVAAVVLPALRTRADEARIWTSQWLR